MAQNNDGSPSTSKLKSRSPVISNASEPLIAVATPRKRTSSSPFAQLDDYEQFCVPEEDLPSKDISQLWQKPLKLTTSSLLPESYDGSNSKDVTPTRKDAFVRSKLLFDHLDSDEKKRSQKSYGSRHVRRTVSNPETATDNSSAPAFNPKKRLKLLNEETSPYEELINSKAALSVLKESNENEKASASSSALTPAVKKLFLKSPSDSVLSLPNCSIKTALEKMEEDPSLIGDGSTSYCLPIKNNGKHPDLKEITGETLAKLMEAKEDCQHVVFKVIDCRFPYEYLGGHIRGAINLYTKDQIKKELLEKKLATLSSKEDKRGFREILIFHCEFSSQRGPTMCHHLRKIDRAANVVSYPNLYYPELYVLFGGYKDFYEKFPSLCDPPEYVPMAHPEHTDNYRRYKSETKFNI